MKKAQLFIIIFIAIALFIAGDYYVNTPDGLRLADSSSTEAPAVTQIEDPYPNLTQELLDYKPSEFNYKILKRERTKQLFEKFDLSNLANAVIYANILEGKAPITIYEIQSKKNQGALVYQNMKLKIVDQMSSGGEINEVDGYGYNSFFYNDINNANTGYLISQIKDNIFGFQYSKADENNFTTIKSMINALMDIDLLI
ncbi:hypothetical protein JW758_05600 [Candidatus Peregrinibacteria bacterium]|nr:hypothetical protein [Candidatus Peregrinibacteria bacterium]